MDIRPFSAADKNAVIALWRACGLVAPQNDPEKDIERKMAFQPDLFLVGVVEERIVAAVMAGYDGHRGWLNYLAVDPGLQRQGLGQQMVAEAESRLRALGCPKINLQVRRSNLAVMKFYESLGFAEDEVASMGKRLVRD